MPTTNVVPPSNKTLGPDVGIEASDQAIGREYALRRDVGQHEVLDSCNAGT